SAIRASSPRSRPASCWPTSWRLDGGWSCSSTGTALAGGSRGWPRRSARATAAGAAVAAAARRGAAVEALEALAAFRLLCAHRRGPHGVSDWTSRVQAWLGAEIGDLDIEQRDYVGRPLLVTENDYELGLYNGDTGVIVHGPAGPPSAAFERGRELLHFS